MKPHVLNTLYLFITLQLGVVHLAQADEASHRKAASDLIALTNSPELFEAAFMLGFEPVLVQFAESGMDEATVVKLEQAGRKFAMKIAGDSDLKSKTIGLYKDAFTEEELNSLTEFYTSPLGKKSLVLMPQLLQAGGAIGLEVGKKYEPEFQREMTQIIEEAKEVAE